MASEPNLKPVEPIETQQTAQPAIAASSPPPSHTAGLEPVHVHESSIRKAATIWLLAAMAVFLIWALFAPIDQGVPVPGSVSVFGKRKAIQHPRGGVVQAILTREGAQVKQGDILIKMNPL